MARASHDVVFEWDAATVKRWSSNPGGPLGRELLGKLAETVLRGAKRRALRRTGRMADEMYFDLIETGTPAGIAARVISPAVDQRSHNFPYPIVHEGRKVRDRRPHRSLRPALRDIRHSVYIDQYRDDEGSGT